MGFVFSASLISGFPLGSSPSPRFLCGWPEEFPTVWVLPVALSRAGRGLVYHLRGRQVQWKDSWAGDLGVVSAPARTGKRSGSARASGQLVGQWSQSLSEQRSVPCSRTCDSPGLFPHLYKGRVIHITGSLQRSNEKSSFCCCWCRINIFCCLLLLLLLRIALGRSFHLCEIQVGHPKNQSYFVM